ncbi:hypothetical protein [Persicitalea sp.]|uniref:hypothetical protein n=1 Tax=Persicitalea sp. TaxID=3100273 RepID=UPI003593A248
MRAGKDIKRIVQSYQGVDFAQVEGVLSNDAETRAILSEKAVQDDLMRGEVIQVKHTSKDEVGNPRHIFGFKLLHLNRQADADQPVLQIDLSGRPLNSSHANRLGVQSLTAKPGYTQEIQTALSKSTNGNSSEYENEVKEISDVMSQKISPLAKAIELKRSLANIADWYFESDFHKRREFLAKTESLFTLGYRQGTLIKSPQAGAYSTHIREQQIPLSDLPTNHKGVPIRERQVEKLLSGQSITVIADPGTEAEGMPEARVKFNPISGNLMEIGEGQPRLSLADQPKKNLETETSFVKRRI